MTIINAVETFVEAVQTSIERATFVKMTFSKATKTAEHIKNIYTRLILIKDVPHLSFTYRYATKDIVKNEALEQAFSLMKTLYGTDFLHITLFTTVADISLKYTKKREARLFQTKASIQTISAPTHDHNKRRFITAVNNLYLQALGISNKEGLILKEGQRKFRQINKYIEIIDSLLQKHPLPSEAHIVDMGCGKGYLTFALHDYLRHQLKLENSITGIELRENLVEFCTNLTKKIGFEQLEFLAQDIHDYQPQKIDMLIALHACDIATDIAIAKGIQSGASIIVVAPCCHKQIRKQLNCTTEMQSILQHGILEERQAELLTDGIRALLLEIHGYRTKVFEFISTEHTAKNVMITATKGKAKPELQEKVQAIKAAFGIQTHYLEQLLA